MGSMGVHEFVTLEGVIDTPTWTFDYPFDPKIGEGIEEIMGGCRAILLGRRTFEMFAPAWSVRTADDDRGAPFMNDSPKYVVAAIRRLKQEIDGGIYVSGSGTLVRAMLADGLIHDLHLFMYPIAIGSGPRLFADVTSPYKLELGAAYARSLPSK